MVLLMVMEFLFVSRCKIKIARCRSCCCRRCLASQRRQTAQTATDQLMPRFVVVRHRRVYCCNIRTILYRSILLQVGEHLAWHQRYQDYNEEKRRLAKAWREQRQHQQRAVRFLRARLS